MTNNIKDKDLKFIYEFRNKIFDIFDEIFEDYKNGLATGTVPDNQFFLHQASEPVKRAVTDLITNRYETSTHWGDKYKIFFPKENDILNQMALTNVLRLKFRVVQKMMDDNLPIYWGIIALVGIYYLLQQLKNNYSNAGLEKSI
jgi:hypothetical protein